MTNEDYIPISTLNDYIFCPYSIYLHNIYMEMDESMYHAVPQTRGRIAHESVDTKQASRAKSDIMSLPVFSEELHLMGIIDLYRGETKTLIERKYQVKRLFQGQIYQLWAQFFCMREMGYDVKHIEIYEMSTHKTISLPTPTEQNYLELKNFIDSFINYKPETTPILINQNKCMHCIYCNMCDKTEVDNVYN